MNRLLNHFSSNGFEPVRFFVLFLGTKGGSGHDIRWHAKSGEIYRAEQSSITN